MHITYTIHSIYTANENVINKYKKRIINYISKLKLHCYSSTARIKI